MKRRVIYISTVVPLVVILSGIISNCTSLTTSRDPRTVTIAVVENDPLTEQGKVNNQSIYAGAKLAADQMKELGGLNLEIELYDDDDDPAKAVQIAEQIANSNALAVIGHSSIETLEAAAEVYNDAGISAINVIPITERLTENYYYHFNITYPSESEAAYLANYLRKVAGSQTATIISTNDGYSQTLARQFKNTFQGLGGKITIEKILNEGDSQEEIVSQIISANTETDNPGTIFLATDEVTSAQLVILMKHKGVSYPIAGASNLSSPVFIQLIESESEEQTVPGYYTDGIITTRAILFDSANRYANQFLEEYQTEYANDLDGIIPQPGDKVINGYDAALAILTAIQKENISGSEILLGSDRQTLYRGLVNMVDIETGVQAIISPIYFEPSQTVNRAARLGIYQNGEIVSANIQFEPIPSPNEIKDLDRQLEKGRILTVNGEYVYKANIVYAGIDLLGIDEIDIKTSTYKMDFYLWFRYRPTEQDEEFKPDDFVFTNSEGEFESILLRDEMNSDGTVLKTYRITGVFKNQFQFHEYPFDHQSLIVKFRNQNATTSFIQYVVDRVGMRYETDTGLASNFDANGAFASVFGWKEQSVRVTQDIFPTSSTLGSPQNFDRRAATNYSIINMEVDLQRDSLQYIIKSLLPLLITLMLAYITFFLPLGHEERLTVGSTALLTTAFFHLSLAQSLPEVGYTVAMELLFYAAYVMSALIVLLETISSRYEKKLETAGKKADRVRFQNMRHDLDMLGRIVYPAIMSTALVLGYYVYNGTIHLGPHKESGAKLLTSSIFELGSPDLAERTAGPTPPPIDDEVVLTLSTWRPEDTAQIQILLDEFSAYALKERGKKITIDHRPVMSVNYDSILDLQLSRGAGPDLMYVRPFSVNGSIVRYLTPLNDFVSVQANYDKTKLTPWTSSEFGLYYAMPFVGVVQGVYYNKDIFDHYSLEVPKTWEELIRTSSALKQADEKMIPIANALNQTEDSEMFMSIAANILGGPNGREKFMKTDGTSLCYNNELVTKTFKGIEDLMPYLPEDAATINSQTGKELFLNGQAAMMFGGSWDLQRVSETADFNWDVFAVPAPQFNPTYVIFQPDIGIGINRASAHSEEAKLFLDWLMTRDGVNHTAEVLPGFYPLNRIEIDKARSADDAKFLRLVNLYPADIRWMYTEISNKAPSALEIVREDLYKMLAFGLTPQEAAQHLQDGLGEWYEPAQTCT